MLALVRSSLEHLTNIPWNEVIPVLEELEVAELSKISKDPAGQALSVVAVASFQFNSCSLLRKIAGFIDICSVITSSIAHPFKEHFC